MRPARAPESRFGRPDPEAILAERLASGDVTPEEYLERLSLLQEK